MKGMKDKQKEEIPGIVYAIGSCGDCRKVYVGETRRTATQRVMDTRLGHLDKSAVAEHAQERLRRRFTSTNPYDEERWFDELIDNI